MYVAYLEGCDSEPEVCLSPGPHNTRQAFQPADVQISAGSRRGLYGYHIVCENRNTFSAFSASIIQSDTGRNPMNMIL